MDKLTLQMVEVISSSLTQQTGQLEKCVVVTGAADKIKLQV